jgi:hypothetical protein
LAVSFAAASLVSAPSRRLVDVVPGQSDLGQQHLGIGPERRRRRARLRIAAQEAEAAAHDAQDDRRRARRQSA